MFLCAKTRQEQEKRGVIVRNLEDLVGQVSKAHPKSEMVKVLNFEVQHMDGKRYNIANSKAFRLILDGKSQYIIVPIKSDEVV